MGLAFNSDHYSGNSIVEVQATNKKTVSQTANIYEELLLSDVDVAFHAPHIYSIMLKDIRLKYR